MKPIFFTAVLLCTLCSFAQINPQTPWTWMKGDNTIDQFGIYGTQGVSNNINKPGARNFATTWRDAAGDLWLFGGAGDGASASGFLNDLWKFTPATNKWTWEKGDSAVGQFSVYGTPGISNAANTPGGSFSSVSWTDLNGNLWLFGGFGFAGNAFGFLNTLWKYESSSNQWTSINHDNTINQAGVYGIQGVGNTVNGPGARYGSQTWTDDTGNLWLYGGYGYGEDTNSAGILNDIWKYDPLSNIWTWIKGDKTIEQVGFYGTKGISNPANKPGARYVSSSWKDLNGDLWLFGGYGYDENNSGNLNDLWKYNPLTNEWTWISGDNTINQPGVYGIQGLPDATNKPGARYVSSSWKDLNGDLWLFGGYGYDAANTGYLNDLWRYSPANNKWTWIKGNNAVDQMGVYGTQGIPDTSNKSGARTGSVSWTDGGGNLWLFGGYGFDGSSSGVLNDLWKISGLQAVLPLHLIHFSGVLNNEAVQLQWQTEQETGFSHFIIQRSFDGISFTSIGTVIGAANSNRNGYGYYDNDLKTRQLQKVFYRLQLMDRDGHFTYSKILRFDLEQISPGISLFPNPVVQSLNLSFNQNRTGTLMISITDMNGIAVKKQTEVIAAGRTSINIDVSNLAAAAYLVSVSNGETVTQQKFIKQ